MDCLNDVLIVEEELLKESIFDCIQTFDDSVSLVFVRDIENEEKSSLSSLQGFLTNHVCPLHEDFDVARVEEVFDSTDLKHLFDEAAEELEVVEINKLLEDMHISILVLHDFFLVGRRICNNVLDVGTHDRLIVLTPVFQTDYRCVDVVVEPNISGVQLQEDGQNLEAKIDHVRLLLDDLMEILLDGGFKVPGEIGFS